MIPLHFLSPHVFLGEWGGLRTQVSSPTPKAAAPNLGRRQTGRRSNKTMGDAAELAGFLSCPPGWTDLKDSYQPLPKCFTGTELSVTFSFFCQLVISLPTCFFFFFYIYIYISWVYDERSH